MSDGFTKSFIFIYLYICKRLAGLIKTINELQLIQYYSLKALSVFFFLLVAQGAFCQSSNVIIPKDVIDLRSFHLDKKSERLTGPCRFFANQLLTPQECKTSEGTITNFPTLFNENKSSSSGLGYATYKLYILLPHGVDDFALTLPQMYSSYKLWANGEVVAINGIIAKTKEECKPQWRPQTVSVNVKSDTLFLVLQIANFHHAKGGVSEPIIIGKSSLMEYQKNVALISKMIEITTLFLIGLFFLFVFLFKRKKRAALYFSLTCITWSVRSLFSNTYLIISLYPDFDWTTLVRIEYITLYLTIIWANLCLSSIFTHETNVFIKYGLLFCCVLFTVFSLSSPPRFFTQGINVYLITAILLLVYGLIVVIRAWINERSGSGLLSISFIIALNIFGYDVFVYEGLSSYNPLVFSIGYMGVFVLMGFALATNLNLIKGKASPTTKLTYEDLYKDQSLQK